MQADAWSPVTPSANEAGVLTQVVYMYAIGGPGSNRPIGQSNAVHISSATEDTSELLAATSNIRVAKTDAEIGTRAPGEVTRTIPPGPQSRLSGSPVCPGNNRTARTTFGDLGPRVLETSSGTPQPSRGPEIRYPTRFVTATVRF